MRERIHFLLGDQPQSLSEVDPSLTVLRWLREEKGRTGTKEGCAEGDCGACTVVLGEWEDGRLRYRAVNACILMLATLDGKQLLTVEDLNEDDRLHPVQQALVEEHGSQCGFCTPGFVMSLFALSHAGGQGTGLDRQDGLEEQACTLGDALAGNLCRCTGYGPILAAAERIRKLPPSVPGKLKASTDMLASMNRDDSFSVSDGERRFFSPATVEELLQLKQEFPQAWILAGGTDIGLWITKERRRPETVIYLGRIKSLKTINHSNGMLEIGAALSLTDALPRLLKHLPQLDDLFRRYGAGQVRNAGTLGGNIANGSPIGDSPPPLMALGSQLLLRGSSGTRELPLEEFFIDYGKQDLRADEIVETIRIPIPREDDHFACYKLSKRFDQDISGVCAAFLLRLNQDGIVEHFRSAWGGMAATPRLAEGMQEAVIGRPWNDSTLELATRALEADFQPISDLRASADYRRMTANHLLRRFYLETQHPEQALRLFGRSEKSHGAR